MKRSSHHLRFLRLKRVLCKLLKPVLWIASALIILAIIAVTIANISVTKQSAGRLYDSSDSIPHNRVGLLLATDEINIDGSLNYDLYYRIEATVKLYNERKIDVILVSGVDNYNFRKFGGNQPNITARYLYQFGVSYYKVELDSEGSSILNSIAKAREVYGLDSLTIIAPKRLNEKAVCLAREMGIEAIGFNSMTDSDMAGGLKETVREYLARTDIYIDIISGRKPDIKMDGLILPVILPDERYVDWGIPRYLNSVRGHKEENFIVGNFTGEGIDTIYIADEPVRKLKADEKKRYSIGYVGGDYRDEMAIWYAVSNNPDIPPVEICDTEGLVYEGDVDGDGCDEWGYLHRGLSSQWRQYRIYNYDRGTKTWRHLYYDVHYDSFLSTPEFIRSSGVDLVEKGPRPGLITIHWGAWDDIIHDTIVAPNYIPISKDAW